MLSHIEPVGIVGEHLLHLAPGPRRALRGGGQHQLRPQRPQDLPPLQRGQRVRVTAPTLGINKLPAVLQSLSGDTLVVHADTTVVCALSETTRLDVYAGRKSRLWLGAGIGLLAGATAGAITWTSIGDCGFIEDTECRVYGALLFGGIGAVAGGVTGLLIKTDRWKEVPLDRVRVSVAPRPNGIGIGARIAF